MSSDISHSLILAFSFLFLFSLAEVLYHFFHLKAEYTRKLVHFSTGFITLLFPVLLSSHWYVLFLCGSFFLILIVSQKFSWLPSINNIDRISRGSISYPIAVYGCFYVYTFFGNYVFFYLPVLILAVSDPVAALLGRRYPKGRYTLFSEQKTLTGSGAFLMSAFIISVILLQSFTVLSHLTILLMSTGIACLTCIAEAIAQKGYDNLTIPFSALAVLVAYSRFFLIEF